MCSASVRVYFILGCILFLLFSFFFLMLRPPLISTLFPYTTLFRSFFQLRAQRCPHACRRIDLLRQFVGRGNNARQVRDKTLAPATFTDVRSCPFRQRRTLECDLQFLVLHGLALHRQGTRRFSRSTLNP